MIPGEYKIRIGERFADREILCIFVGMAKKKASYIEEISTMVSMIFHC